MYSLVHRVHNIGSRGFDLANKIRACRLSPQFAPLRRLWVPVGVCSGRVSKRPCGPCARSLFRRVQLSPCVFLCIEGKGIAGPRIGRDTARLFSFYRP